MTRRRRTLIFIHALLAVVIAAALGYYTVRTDENDERYAWRMFSANRMVSCGTGELLPAVYKGQSRRPPTFSRGPQFLIGEQKRPAQLGRLFHMAWINLTKRGRESVIEAMAVELCKSNPGKPVYVLYDCAHVDGRVTIGSAGGFDVCRTGKL